MLKVEKHWTGICFYKYVFTRKGGSVEAQSLQS